MGLPPTFIRVLREKQLLYCKIFGIWELMGGGVTIFDETPKGTSLDDFTPFEPLHVEIHSRVLSLGD